MRKSDRKVSLRGVFSDPALDNKPAAFRYLWTELVQRCARAEKTLEITPDDYYRLMGEYCRYCGTPPMNWTKYKCESMPYNGVDRLDNSIGYTLDNLVPCCKTCNSFKSKMSASEMVAHARRIVRHNA